MLEFIICMTRESFNYNLTYNKQQSIYRGSQTFRNLEPVLPLVFDSRATNYKRGQFIQTPLLWSSDLSSGIYCRVKYLSTDVSEVRAAFVIITRRSDDVGSTYLWNVGRQLFYTAAHPRRQTWTSYSPPWELEISPLHWINRDTKLINKFTCCSKLFCDKVCH
jgi:hypothetical protein